MDDHYYTPLAARIRDLEDAVWRATLSVGADEPVVGRSATRLNLACERLCGYVDAHDLPISQVMDMMSAAARQYVQIYVAANILKKHGLVVLPMSPDGLTLMVSAS